MASVVDGSDVHQSRPPSHRANPINAAAGRAAAPRVAPATPAATVNPSPTARCPVTSFSPDCGWLMLLTREALSFGSDSRTSVRSWAGVNE